VQEILVEEGQQVRQNAPLLRLRGRAAEIQVTQAEANLRQAQTRLDQAGQSHTDHQYQLEQVGQAIVIAKSRVDAQQQEVDRITKLYEGKLLSKEEYEGARILLHGLQAALQIERTKEKQLKLQDPAHTVSLAEANLAAARAGLALAQEHLAEHTLTAPMDGVVLRILVTPGTVLGIHPTEPAVWFRPDRPWIVRCEIEQEFIRRITPGMRCDIYEDRLDQPQWKGTVRRCSDWVAPRRYRTNDPRQRRDVHTMECIIDVEGKPNLLIGQRVRVAIRSGP
jgi:multidrug resistance efflux pump